MEERMEECNGDEIKRANPKVVAYILGVFGTIFISTIATMGAKNQDKNRSEIENPTYESVRDELVRKATNCPFFSKIKDTPAVDRYNLKQGENCLDIAYRNGIPYFVSYSGNLPQTKKPVKIIDFLDTLEIDTYIEDNQFEMVRDNSSVRSNARDILKFIKEKL